MATYLIQGNEFRLTNRKITNSRARSAKSTPVDNALGWVIDVEKIWIPDDEERTGMSLGLRHVSIKYNLSKLSKESDGRGLYLIFSIINL